MDLRKFISGAMAVSMLAAATVTASAQAPTGLMTEYDSGMIEWTLGPKTAEENGAYTFTDGSTYYINDTINDTQPESGPYLKFTIDGGGTSWLWYGGDVGGCLRFRKNTSDNTRLTFTAPSDGTLTVVVPYTDAGFNIYTGETVHNDTTYIGGHDGKNRTLTVAVTENTVYTLWCGAKFSAVQTITFKPEFSSEAAENKGTFTESAGDAARAWGVAVDLSQYSSVSSSLKWDVTAGEKSGSVDIKNVPALSGTGSVSFGLILTGTSEQLDAVNSVALSAE